MKKLQVNPSPCASCPYRYDTPPGIWDASEYEKLRLYDENPILTAVFLCHYTPDFGHETVCRGWLTVHAETVAARLAVSRGLVTDEERYAPVVEELYLSGTEAAEAGMAGVTRPSPSARKVIDRLTETRRKR